MLAPNTYQAQYAIPDLTPGNTPTGSEVIEAVQGGQSVQLTLAQVAALAVSPTVPTIRLPAFASTINILTSDIEVGISTATGVVTVNLPSAVAWAAAVPGGALGHELLIIDATGNAAAHNVTWVLNGADTFLQGALPPLAVNYGSLRLRPFGSPVSGWFVKGYG